MFQVDNKTAKMEELEIKFAELDREIKDAQLSKGLRGTRGMKNAMSRRSRIKNQWMKEWMAIDRPTSLDEALEQLGREYAKGFGPH